MKLSPKTRPKILKNRNFSGGHGFRWDNGEVAFGTREQRKHIHQGDESEKRNVHKPVR